MENVYYKRFEEVWKSINCSNANEFAFFLGYARSEKISRLKRADNKFPGIEIIETILKKIPKINARWLLTGEGMMMVEDSLKEYAVNGSLNIAEDGCGMCRIKDAEINKLKSDLLETKDKYISLLEQGEAKKENRPQNSAQAG